MSAALQNRAFRGLASGLAAIFMVAAMTPPVEAKTKPHHKSHTTTQQAKGAGHSTAPAPVAERHFDPEAVDSKAYNTCIQKIDIQAANTLGYNSLRTLRRATALAEVMKNQGRDSSPVAAIAGASYRVGVDFDLLLMKAVLESTLGQYDEPRLGGPARGLFQYMPASFTTLFNWFGGKFENGLYADVAAMIEFDEKGNTYTKEPELRDKILSLRSDHYVAAFIKAKEIREIERPVLRAVLGREPTVTDFYVAHFLGLPRATTFFRIMRKSPKTPAVSIFITESNDPNNRPLFYSKEKALSLRQLYDRLSTIITSKMSKIDHQINQELRTSICLKPLDLTPPPRQKIDIPLNPRDNAFPHSPPPPRDDIPIEPDAITKPIPVPASTPAPSSDPIMQQGSIPHLIVPHTMAM